MQKSIFILFLFLINQTLFAQDYLGNDRSFFDKKTKQYQRWIEAKGMGDVLKADKYELKKNGMELELFLSMRTSNPDTAAAMWRNLEVEFAMSNPDEQLGNTLFETFVRMMEIPAEQGNVQVYFPMENGQGYHRCFYVWLWEEDGKMMEEERINACRAQEIRVKINLPEVKKDKSKTVLKVQSEDGGREVFDKILKYARKRYEKQVCEERNPRVGEEEISDYKLKFTATDLCQEVLTDESRSLWCELVRRWWGPCNDMRRERLEFEFSFHPEEGGYTLLGKITGKFGSGVYRPRISGYMDMDPDFEEDFLAPYAKRFQQELKAYLEQ